jgi:hypothetical protein
MPDGLAYLRTPESLHIANVAGVRIKGRALRSESVAEV